MKSAEYLLCPLRWEVALDIRDNQNQNAEQHHNLDCVVNEELNAAADSACGIQSASIEYCFYESV